MGTVDLKLTDLESLFPRDFSADQIAHAKTLMLQELSLSCHKFYGGKMTTLPKAGIFGFNWFNVWYTPGVSLVSTSIRDSYDLSFDLTNRGNHVAIVSDSTRVLGDGDVTPPGGLGVMEGKAFLMKYLGGVDGTALCIDSRDENGRNSPDKIIDFVKMVQHSFGAINLEDISQPNCFKVLDTLREVCEIPVWHDDQQGTGCVTVAALLNALKIVDKPIDKVRIFMYGAGASNTAIARLILAAGADPEQMILFDSKGSLNRQREDLESDPRWYRKWELCQKTNPKCIKEIAEAVKGADALIALSRPDPTTVKPDWIRSMGAKPIVFACANPVPEIYPHAAKEAGAYIVATGRGDFENQVNNSLGFPGILKGSLLVRARKITDGMAIAAARSIALSAEKRGLSPNYIIPMMNEEGVFPEEAAATAVAAVNDGVARVKMPAEDAYKRAERDITHARRVIHQMIEEGLIPAPPLSLIEEAAKKAIAAIEAA